MALPEIFVRIGAKIDDFEKSMGTVSARLNAIDRDVQKTFRGFDTIGGRLSDLGGSLTLGLTAPIAGASVAAVKLAGDFEASLNRISAFGDITGKDLTTLRDLAIKLGKDTKFSAQEAADGMAVLANSGFNAKQVVASIGGVLNLAAAGMVSISDAAEITQDSLSQFGLSADQSQRVADVLTGVLKETASTMGELATAMTYVGPSARSLGLTIEETSAAIIQLDKAGIRGEKAGTGLRGVLDSLVAPSTKAKEVINQLGISLQDAEGNFRKLPDIMGQFQSALSSKFSNPVERAAAISAIFGRESKNTAEILIANVPALDAYGKKMLQVQGAAESTAKTLNAGFKGAVEELKGSVETAGIALGNVMLPAATNLAKQIQALVNDAVIPLIGKFSALPASLQNVIVGMTGFAALIGPAILTTGQFIIGLSGIGKALGYFGEILKTISLTSMIASLQAARVALVAFALETVPLAITAISAMSSAMLSQAAASFTRFATVSIPDAIAGLVTFATSAVPTATASLTTLSLSAIPAAISAFANFARGGIAAAGAALYTFATVQVTAAVSALETLALTTLPILGVAAIAAATAFAAWKLGEWAYQQIPAVKALGDAIGDLILKIPGVTAAIGYLTGTSEKLDEANKNLESSVAQLESRLSKHGITVDRANRTTQEYAKALREAAAKAGLFGSESETQRAKVEALKKQIQDADKNARLYKQALDELGKGAKASGDEQKKAGAITKDVSAETLVWNARLQVFVARQQEAVRSLAQLHVAIGEGAGSRVELQKGLEKLVDGMGELKQSIEKLPSLPQSLRVSETVKAINELQEAYRRFGIKTRAELEETVKANKAAFEKIAADAGNTSTQALEAWIRYEESRQEAARRTGQIVTETERKELEARQKQLEGALGKQTKETSRFAQQVSTIISDLGRDIAKATVNLFKGLFGFDGFNKKLEEDSKKLRDELAERTSDLDEFERSNRARIAALETGNATQLAKETGELRDALATRVNEYGAYVLEVAVKLDNLRDAESTRLADEVRDLNDKLLDKERAYEDYVREVERKESDIRNSAAEKLADQLSDLHRNLRDRTQAYEDFAADTRRSLQSIESDLAESIEDATKTSNRKLEDEDRDFVRDKADLNDKIFEAEAKGDKKAAEEHRKNLTRRVEDHERSTRRIREDLEAQVREVKRRAEQQREAAKVALERRSRDHQEFVAGTIDREKEITDNSQKELDRQLSDLHDALQSRSDELRRYQAETEAAISEAESRSAARYAKEEAELRASLGDKQRALEQYQRDVEEKIDALTAKYADKQREEVAALELEFQNKLKEYDKYRKDVEKKLEELADAHKGPLDRIAEMFKTVFGSAAEAILRVASEEVIGVLVKRIGGLIDDVFPSLGKAIDGILSRIPSGGDSATPSVPVPSGGGGGGGTPGGGAGGAASSGSEGILGVINAVTGVVTAISSVISAIYAIRSEGTLNAIEENTRFAQIGIIGPRGIIDNQNRYLPYLQYINQFNYDVFAPWMYAIQQWAEEQNIVQELRLMNQFLRERGSGESQPVNLYVDGRLLYNGLTGNAESLGGAI